MGSLYSKNLYSDFLFFSKHRKCDIRSLKYLWKYIYKKMYSLELKKIRYIKIYHRKDKIFLKDLRKNNAIPWYTLFHREKSLRFFENYVHKSDIKFTKVLETCIILNSYNKYLYISIFFKYITEEKVYSIYRILLNCILMKKHHKQCKLLSNYESSLSTGVSNYDNNYLSTAKYIMSYDSIFKRFFTERYLN